MSQVTTLQIGGPARDFKIVKTKEELMQIQQPFLLIGGGSNLLVSDEGVDKLVVKNEIIGIEQNGNILKVKSGTNLQDLVDYCIQHGLSGLQKMTGIPGTVGGAVYGNAGAYGQTISDHLIEVTTLKSRVTKEGCNFAYRDNIFKKNKDIILEITFDLQKANVSALQKEADETLEKRLVKYPKGIKCPGSFFKNIVADTLPKYILDKIPSEKIVYGKLPAGSLLEMVGAKGDHLGKIEIAPYHANLFINKGEGSAKDFYDLAKKYVILVKEKFGITLEPEVQLINLPPLN